MCERSVACAWKIVHGSWKQGCLCKVEVRTLVLFLLCEKTTMVDDAKNVTKSEDGIENESEIVIDVQKICCVHDLV